MGRTQRTVPCALSGGKYTMNTNAPYVDNLNGPSYQFGGSATVIVPGEPVGINAGCEFNIIPDPKNNRTYYGKTSYVGIAIPDASAEVHVEWGETRTIFEFNIFDTIDKAYIRIMEW